MTTTAGTPTDIPSPSPSRLRLALTRLATPSLLIGAAAIAIVTFGIIAPFFVADPLAISN